MNIQELNSFRMADAITFHDTLNPKLWNNNKLRPEVKKQLEIIAQDFLMELGVNELDVTDITVSGSNAAYSYTPHSDLDLHILVNLKDLPNNEVYKELFNAKKTLYNDSHDIKIHGVPVELYVQDASEPVVSLGEYSIKNDKWLKIPSKRRANFDQAASKLKYNKLLELIQHALSSGKLKKVQKIITKIKQYRQAGLDKGGEFGPENLAYKALRSQGYITKLYKLRDKLHSEKLTIETMYKNIADEDYDPNGPPPGPEFNPTMPAGTVKVDVSDVYDWYKLGQHVSNLKGLGKHDFGKGPPSTIMAFGDEDTEHEYIKDLEKTGLTTTDIDPFDPNQPKGMKRQKIDPTYNVAEGLEQTLSSMVSQDQAERNEYATFVKTQAGGDWSKGAKMYAQLKKRPSNDIFGDATRLNQFMKMKFDFDKFTDEDWDNYWLLAQHCDNNRDFQKNALSIIKKYQGTDNSHYKYLYDRISMGLTGKQKYGTQNVKEQGMTEGFDQPYPLKWEKSDYGDVDALASLPDGSPLSIMFNKQQDNEGEEVVEVEFYRNNSQEVTGEGDAMRIFATVLAAIHQYVKKYKPARLTFSARKEVEQDQNPESRAKLYNRLVQRYAQAWGYRAASADHDDIVIYELSRISNVAVAKEDETLQYAAEKTPVISPYAGVKERQFRGSISEVSGYIPSEKEKNDPRFKTALTVDVKPYTMKKDAKKFGNKISRAGIPPTANPSGKF
jgi:hypothetical protein